MGVELGKDAFQQINGYWTEKKLATEDPRDVTPILKGDIDAALARLKRDLMRLSSPGLEAVSRFVLEDFIEYGNGLLQQQAERTKLAEKRAAETERVSPSGVARRKAEISRLVDDLVARLTSKWESHDHGVIDERELRKSLDAEKKRELLHLTPALRAQAEPDLGSAMELALKRGDHDLEFELRKVIMHNHDRVKAAQLHTRRSPQTPLLGFGHHMPGHHAHEAFAGLAMAVRRGPSIQSLLSEGGIPSSKATPVSGDAGGKVDNPGRTPTSTSTPTPTAAKKAVARKFGSMWASKAKQKAAARTAAT